MTQETSGHSWTHSMCLMIYSEASREEYARPQTTHQQGRVDVVAVGGNGRCLIHASAGAWEVSAVSEPASGGLFALGGGLLGIYCSRGKLLGMAHSLFHKYVHVHDLFLALLSDGNK
jgi:hypothetical protein